MAADYPVPFYRRPIRKALRQGDIALCELSQLRHRNRDTARGPAEDLSAPDLANHGAHRDLEVDADDWPWDGAPPVVRLWQSLVIVLSQNCEIEYANDDDSRLLVAPLASEDRWPEGPWDYLRKNVLPGYFFLPGLGEAEEDERKALGLEQEWPEAAVDLAGATAVSRGLVQSRRVLSLETAALAPFQDKISRFFTTRGYADQTALQALAGRQIVDAVQTDAIVSGPTRLSKMTIAETAAGEGDDDEITLYVGTRA
jgi:hypothetical protein